MYNVIYGTQSSDLLTVFIKIIINLHRRQMDVYQYTGFPKIARAFPSNFTEKADDSCPILR